MAVYWQGLSTRTSARTLPSLAWSERLVRWYSNRFGVIYGDQSVFVRRAAFDAMGGYRDIPLMEDVELSERLRRSGRSG